MREFVLKALAQLMHGLPTKRWTCGRCVTARPTKVEGHVETLIHKDRRKSQRFAVQIVLQAQVDGRRIIMQSENISIDGMFLSCKEFIRPQLGFFARLWLPSKEESLLVYLASCFLEQTWAGYGLGVYISGISAVDRALWESFYHSCTGDQTTQPRPCTASEQALHNRRIAVVGGALDPLALQLLRRQGCEVSTAHSVPQVLELIEQERMDAVICDVRNAGADGLALCCAIKSRQLPTRTVLLSGSATPKEFLLGLFAGATRVIAKSYSNEMLLNCIAEVVQRSLPRGAKKPAPSGAAAGLDATAWAQPRGVGLWDAAAEATDRQFAA